VSNKELGSANGFINIGGFLAALLMIGAIGIALDAQRAVYPDAALYDAVHFKFALSVQFLVIGFGLWRFSAANRKLLRGELVA
jgi:hypothetical protein